MRGCTRRQFISGAAGVAGALYADAVLRADAMKTDKTARIGNVPALIVGSPGDYMDPDDPEYY